MCRKLVVPFILMFLVLFGTTAFAGHWTAPASSATIMHLAGNLTIDGSPAQVGDEVAVFGAGSTLIGLFVVDTASQYGDLVVVGDVPSTTTVSEGATAGELLTVKVWKASSSKEYSVSEISLAATSSLVQFSYNPATLPLAFTAGALSGLNITATAAVVITAPGAPTAVTAAAGNAQATVSFTAPVSNGGAAITGYTVTSTPGGITATGTASPITVTGLTNGTAYTFTVTATNSAGTGAASGASGSVTPVAVAPGAPTAVTAVAGDTKATVSFTAPASNGGATITGYTVTSSPGSITATGTASPITVTGLTNGTPYTFTVIATNSTGPGAASSASGSVTPVLDVTGPTLILSTIASGGITNNSTLNVAGTVTDSATGVKSLTVNTQAVTPAADGSFSVAITLVDGSNIITTVATDNANNKTTDTRTITLDTTAPTLTVTAPADNSKTALAASTVTGTISETSTVTVKVGTGTPQSAAITGSDYSSNINLVSGLNTITVTATDLAGNKSTDVVRTVTYDGTNPSLAITDPMQDITTELNSITIGGTVTDAVTSVIVTITVDNQSYTPTVTNGAFSQLITLDTLKTYAVAVTAKDEVGNTATAQRNIIRAASSISSGDLNGDGAVNVADALKVLRIAVGLDPATASDYAKGDVAPLKDGKPLPDGVIDIADALVVLEKAVNLVSW
jgi:hypothetical protein